MECIHCGKKIEDTDEICPHCGRGQYHVSEKKDDNISFGDISATDYGNETLVVESKEKEKNKEDEEEKISIFKIIKLIVLFSIILGGIYFSYVYFIARDNNVSIKNIDNYLKDISKPKSGEINITIKRNEETTKLKGTFNSDLSVPYFYTSLLKDLEGEIVLDSDEQKIEILLDDKGLYETSTATGILTYFKSFIIPSITSFLIEKNIEDNAGEEIKLNFFENTVDVVKKNYEVEDFTVSIYQTEENLYRIVISKPRQNLVINIDKNKYYYTYYVNDENIVSGELKIRDKSDRRIYEFTVDTINDLRDIKVELIYDNNDFKEKKVEKYENIESLSETNKLEIKNRLRNFLGI